LEQLPQRSRARYLELPPALREPALGPRPQPIGQLKQAAAREELAGLVGSTATVMDGVGSGGETYGRNICGRCGHLPGTESASGAASMRRDSSASAARSSDSR